MRGDAGQEFTTEAAENWAQAADVVGKNSAEARKGEERSFALLRMTELF